MKRKTAWMMVLTMALSVASLTGTDEGLAAKKTVFAKEVETNLLSKVNEADVTPENLGIPGQERYGTSYYAKNIWDMAVVDGKVMLSMGDYNKNTGAVPIYYYTNDSATKKECTYESVVSTSGLSSEEIKRFFMIDGKLCATATDPLGYAQGSYYIYDSDADKWTDYYKLPLCIHCYDMVEYDGEIFFAGMIRNNNDKIISCVQKLDKANFGTQTNATNIEFYRADGIKFNPVETSGKYSDYWRAYDMFVYKGELYVAHSSTASYTYTTDSGLFKYDKANNRFVQVYDGTKVKGFLSVARHTTSFTNADENGKYITPAVKFYFAFEDNAKVYAPLTAGQEEIYSEPLCGAKISTADTFVAVANGIFKASDVEATFEEVSLGKGYENYVTRDAIEVGGKYYFLASLMNGNDDFTTAVFETDGNFNQFRKVFSFSTPSFARSFAYNDGYVYVGLGGNGGIDNVGESATNAYSGTLYRVDLSKWVDETKTEEPTTTETKTEASTTTEQKTEAPTTTETKTEAPTTTETKTEAPTTTETKTEAPTTTETKTEAPTTTETKTEAPTTTETKTEAPTTTERKTEAPTTTETKTETPTTTETKTEAPTTTERKTEAPTTTETKMEAPTTTEAKTEKPTTTENKTEKPATTETKTETPTTTERKTEAPTTTETKTEKPATTERKTETPSTTETKTEKPATTETKTEEPTTTETKTEKPATTENKTEKPTTTETKTEKPATTENKTEKPTTTETKTEKPTTTENKTEKPATTENKTETPTTTETKTEKPTTTENKTEIPATTENKTEKPATTENKTEKPATTENKTEIPATTESQTEAPSTTEITTENQPGTEESTESQTEVPSTTEITTEIQTGSEENTESQATTEKPATMESTTENKVRKTGEVIKVDYIKYKVLKVENGGGTVECIGADNKKCKTIVLPATISDGEDVYKVTSVGKYAFKNCRKLTSVTIGSNVTTVGKEAFKGCSKLKKITIKSKKLKTVGKNAFKGIKSDAKIQVPSSKKKAYKKLLKDIGIKKI